MYSIPGPSKKSLDRLLDVQGCDPFLPLHHSQVRQKLGIVGRSMVCIHVYSIPAPSKNLQEVSLNRLLEVG